MLGLLKEELNISINLNEFIRLFREFSTHFFRVDEQVFEVAPRLLNFTERRDNIVNKL
jgi:hypothetical protein